MKTNKKLVKRLLISSWKQFYKTEEFIKNCLRSKKQKELIELEEFIFYLIKHHCLKCETNLDDVDVCPKCGEKYTYRIKVDAWNEYVLGKKLEQDKKRAAEVAKDLRVCKKHGMTTSLQLKENLPPFCTHCIAEVMAQPIDKELTK
jgi:hypothetical protein